MPRIVVPDFGQAVKSFSLDIRISDINYGRHLANDAVLRFCHEARLKWLADYGFSELDAGSVGLIMADAAVQYLAQAYHGDCLDIEMAASDVGRSSFSLLYRFVRRSDGMIIAKVQTGMVCFDYGSERICRMPEALKMVLEKEA